MVIVLSAIDASSLLCVTMIKVCLYLSRKLRNNSCSCDADLLSKFPEGSSANTTGGLLIKALATATLCCSPPESSLGL